MKLPGKVAIRIGLILVGMASCQPSRASAGGIVAVVSAKSPVTALSRNQVVDIFLGKASRFPDGTEAVPIDQAEGAPARDEFYRDFADKSEAQLKAYWSKIIFTGRGQPPEAAANGREVKKFVAENPGAIGYIEQGMVDSSVKVVLSQ
jgi:ABC-type phosphate transport system substrate-binding protein